MLEIRKGSKPIAGDVRRRKTVPRSANIEVGVGKGRVSG